MASFKVSSAVFFLTLSVGSSTFASYCGLDGGAFPSGPDQDGDGFALSGGGLYPERDCDDNNWQVIPDAWRNTGSGYQRCDGVTGSWTPPAQQPSEGADNYFVDCTAAFNGNGTYASPWNTTRMFTYLYPSQQPAGYHQPIAGDTFWIAGPCTDGHDFDGPGSNSNQGVLPIVMTRGVAGTSSLPVRINAWPGKDNRFVLDNTNANRGVFVLQSSHIIVSGFEVYGDAHTDGPVGISVSDSDRVELKHNHVHDINGPAQNNVACIGVPDSDKVWIHHNEVKDCFDNSNFNTGSAQNNRNIVYFQGTGNLEEFNVNGYTNAAFDNVSTGECTGYKHGNTSLTSGSVFEARHNRYFNCATCVAGGQAGMNIHSNYCRAWRGCFGYEDLGGPFYPNNLLLENNTCIGQPLFSVDWSSADSTPSDNIVANNVTVSSYTATSFYASGRSVNDSRYGDSALYALTSNVQTVDYTGNCYFNDTGTGSYFNHFEAGPPSSVEGGLYPFNLWQQPDNAAPNSKPAWDDDSFEENPMLDASCSIAQSANCAGKGYYASVTPVATCNGKPVTVLIANGDTTTPGDDVVLGTPGADLIKGKAGNDTICGMGGDDFIHGNSGNDWIDGGDGIDNLRGGYGDDTLYAGAGATVGTSSRVFGGYDNDTIYGGPDADDLRGGRGMDTIYGDDGNDEITGNEDDDRVYGGQGDDQLKGGNGENDELYGGAGADSLNGGSGGNDLCDGGGDPGDTQMNCEI